MTTIKLRIDIQSGTIELETDAANFDSVMDRTSALLDQFLQVSQTETEGEPPDVPRSPNTADAAPAPDPTPATKRRRGSGTAKVADWQMVPDLLNEQQRLDLKTFYAEKSPQNQNEQVAVLCFKVKELKGITTFTGNDVYTAFQVVGKRTPGNLTAVFGNMVSAGLGSVVDKKFSPNFKTDDLVKHDLPRKAPTK
ncbi:hypothetical protein PRN20_21395 [Devosia sp. ZB163]|uniref:hypothetical protein n=1 Tax=Devosia sp. ZB163 TaxID=3025938 RepID=UPI00235E90ED|nr:hypothetical protein [Devosia sp. ZB163]MDC9826298.1 hypothetical protein [Devosia sp. ZB163]